MAMKNIKILFRLFLILPICFLGCKEENKPDDSVIIYEAGDQKFGWAKGTKEGHQWEASGYWRYHANDSTLWGIDFITYSIEGFRRESFALNEIVFKKGTYAVKGTLSDLGDGHVGGSYARLAADGDAVLGVLESNDDEDGFVTITEIDSLTNTMKGFFEIYFINEEGGLKVEIKDGEFEVRLYEE